MPDSNHTIIVQVSGQFPPEVGDEHLSCAYEKMFPPIDGVNNGALMDSAGENFWNLKLIG